MWPAHAVRLSFGNPRADFTTAHEGRVDEFFANETIQQCAIFIEMAGLPAYRRLPFKAQPGKITIDAFLIFLPTSRRVDVFDAQQETSAFFTGQPGVETVSIHI